MPSTPSPGPVRLSPRVRALLRRMPKAELHLHLDGSLRPQTALELARERHLDQGDTLRRMRARLVAPPRCADQAELLRAFDLPASLLQDAEALRRAAAELVEDVASDGTRYAEVRWAPALHTRRGLDLREGISAVLAGTRDGERLVRARGGSVQVRLICTAIRGHEPADNAGLAEQAVGFMGDGLVGFDLAGPEAANPDPLVHRRAFDVARSAGLGITVHAGEWGGPAQVWRALEVGPARIAHGAPAALDARLMRELAARDVTLDLCPTSNAQAAIVPELAAHPLPLLLRAGVPVTLSTDDRTVSDVSLVDEYERAVRLLGLRLPELWRVDRHALRAAFLHHDEQLREQLQAEFDRFAAGEPRLEAPVSATSTPEVVGDGTTPDDRSGSASGPGRSLR